MGERLDDKDVDFEPFFTKLPLVCDKETSQDPDGWREDNPLWGHCAVVSLVAQDFWGGELLRTPLSSVKGFEHMRSHYWNLLGNGEEIDFTKSQFGNDYPQNMQPEVRSRDYVLSFPETVKRYELLKSRLDDIITKIS